ncbi:hypothetical protein CQJ94_23110, partial [Glycomyces fuscus]
RHNDEFLTPYNPASPIGAGAFDNAAKATTARNDFADLFARHFGDHLGESAARDLGRDYANTLTRNWNNPDLGQHLRQVLDNRLPPHLRDHLANVPVNLQKPLNDYFSTASAYAQQTGGSVGSGALEGYLGEGLGSLADGRGWEASVWSATAGASQAGIQQGTTDGTLAATDLFSNKDKPNLTPPPPPRTESDSSTERGSGVPGDGNGFSEDGFDRQGQRGSDGQDRSGADRQDRGPGRDGGDGPSRENGGPDRDTAPVLVSDDSGDRDDRSDIDDVPDLVSDTDSDTDSEFGDPDDPDWNSDDTVRVHDDEDTRTPFSDPLKTPGADKDPFAPYGSPDPKSSPHGLGSNPFLPGPLPPGLTNDPLTVYFLNEIVPANPEAGQLPPAQGAPPPGTETTAPPAAQTGPAQPGTAQPGTAPASPGNGQEQEDRSAPSTPAGTDNPQGQPPGSGNGDAPTVERPSSAESAQTHVSPDDANRSQQEGDDRNGHTADTEQVDTEQTAQNTAVNDTDQEAPAPLPPHGAEQQDSPEHQPSPEPSLQQQPESATSSDRENPDQEQQEDPGPEPVHAPLPPGSVWTPGQQNPLPSPAPVASTGGTQNPAPSPAPEREGSGRPHQSSSDARGTNSGTSEKRPAPSADDVSRDQETPLLPPPAAPVATDTDSAVPESPTPSVDTDGTDTEHAPPPPPQNDTDNTTTGNNDADTQQAPPPPPPPQNDTDAEQHTADTAVNDTSQETPAPLPPHGAEQQDSPEHQPSPEPSSQQQPKDTTPSDRENPDQEQQEDPGPEPVHAPLPPGSVWTPGQQDPVPTPVTDGVSQDQVTPLLPPPAAPVPTDTDSAVPESPVPSVNTTTDTGTDTDTRQAPPPPPPPPQNDTDTDTTTGDTTTDNNGDNNDGDTQQQQQEEETPDGNYPGSVTPDRTGAPYDIGYLLTSSLVNSSMIHAEHLRSFVDDALSDNAGRVDAAVRDAVREQIDAQARRQMGAFFRPEGFSTTVTGADGSTWRADLRLNPSREGFRHAPTQPEQGSSTELKLVDEAGESNPAEGGGSHGGNKLVGLGFQVSPLLLGTVGGSDIGPRFTISFSGGTRQRQTGETTASIHDGYTSYEIKGKPEVYAADLSMSFDLTPVPAPGNGPARDNAPADGPAPGDAPANRGVNARAESPNGVLLVLPGKVVANAGPESIRLRDPFATEDHQRGRDDDARPAGPHADKGHPVWVGDIRLSDGSSDKPLSDWIADHLWSPEQDRGWWQSTVDKMTPGFVDKRRQQRLDAFRDQVGEVFSERSVRNNLPKMTSGPAVFTVTDPSGTPRLVSVQSVPTSYDAKPHTIQPAKYIKGNKSERESGTTLRHHDVLGGSVGAGVSVDAGAPGGLRKVRVDAIALEGGVRGRATEEGSRSSSGSANRINYGKTPSSAYDVQRNYYVHFDGEPTVYRFQGDTVEILTVQEARILNGDEPSDKVPSPPAPVRTAGDGTAPEPPTVDTPEAVPDTNGDQRSGDQRPAGDQDGSGRPAAEQSAGEQPAGEQSGNGQDGNQGDGDTRTGEQDQRRGDGQDGEQRSQNERSEVPRPPRPNLAEERPVTFHGAVPRDFTWPDGSQYREIDGQQRSIYQQIAHEVLTGLAAKRPGLVLPELARNPKNFARRPGHEITGPFTGSTREHRPFRRDHDAAVFNTHRVMDAISASAFKSGTDDLTLHGQPIHLIDTGRFDPSALFKPGKDMLRPPFVTVRVTADFSALRHAGETKRGTGGEYAGASERTTGDGSQTRKTARLTTGAYIRRIDTVDAAENPSDGGVFSVSGQLNRTKGDGRGLGVKTQSEEVVQYAEDSSVWNSTARFSAKLYENDDLGMVLGGDRPLADRGHDLLDAPVEALATMDTAKAVTDGERGGRGDAAPQATRIRPIPVERAKEMIDGHTAPDPGSVRRRRDVTGTVRRWFGGGRDQQPPGGRRGDGAPPVNPAPRPENTAGNGTGQQNTGTPGTGQQDSAGNNTGQQNTGTRTGDVPTPPTTETTGTDDNTTGTTSDNTNTTATGNDNNTTGQQDTETAPAPDTNTDTDTIGQDRGQPRSDHGNVPDIRTPQQRRAELIRDLGPTVEHVNTRFTTGDGNRVGSLLDASYENFSSVPPWERGDGVQRTPGRFGFERKLRHFLVRGQGSRQFYANALSPENLAGNPALQSSGGARTRTEMSGGLLSPHHVRATTATQFDIDSVDRFEQSDGAIVWKDRNTLEVFTRTGERTDLSVLATGGGRFNTNPVRPAGQPADGTAPAPNSASAPLIQLGPSAGKSLFDRYTNTKPTSKFSETVEFHPKIPMSYAFSASGRVTQAMEFVKNWSIGPTIPRAARYRGWQADVRDLVTGLIHIRDAHQAGLVEDRVEETDSGPVRVPQPEPDRPASVRPRPGFEDSGKMIRPADPDEALQSLADDLASQGWELTRDSRETILHTLNSHTGLNPNTGTPVPVKVRPIDHSIGNLNAPTTAPLSLDATVNLRLDRGDTEVKYLGGKTEYRQRQGWENGDRLQQGEESSASAGAQGSLLTPLPQSGGDQPGGTSPSSRPYLMGLYGDASAANAHGNGGIARNTDKRSVQLTMETPYARVSSDTRLTIDLHISDKQGFANSLTRETPGSGGRRDFTGTGDSGRVEALYPTSYLDLPGEGGTTGGSDTAGPTGDGRRTGNRTSPENPSNDHHASLADMMRNWSRTRDPDSRGDFKDAVVLPTAVENNGKGIRDLAHVVVAKSLGWPQPDGSVRDGRYTPESIKQAAEYAADKLELNSRNNAVDHSLNGIALKALFSEANNEGGTELIEMGRTTWGVRAVPRPETARVIDYNPSARLTDSSESGRTFSPFHNDSSTTTMGFDARPSGRSGTGPPTTATLYGSANTTGSSTSGGDTARGSKPKEPPHSDRVRTGPAYLVEIDTDWAVGARSELRGPWYKRSARYVGDKTAAAGRYTAAKVRGVFGDRSAPAPGPSRPARWQRGETSAKVTVWLSHGDAVKLGVLTPDDTTRIAPLTERFSAAQKALGDAEKAYLDARLPLDGAAADRIASPDDPRVRQRYDDLEAVYRDRLEKFNTAERNWERALRELRDGLAAPAALPRPRTQSAPFLDTIQEEPPPPPQGDTQDPAADPEAIELPERGDRQTERNDRQTERGDQRPEQGTGLRSTGPGLLDRFGSDLNLRPKEAEQNDAPPAPEPRAESGPAPEPETGGLSEAGPSTRTPEEWDRFFEDLDLGRPLTPPQQREGEGDSFSDRGGQGSTTRPETAHDHGTDFRPDQETSSETSSITSEHLRDMRLRLQRLMSTDPSFPGEAGQALPDAGPTGDHGGRQPSAQPETHRAPAPERAADPDDGHATDGTESLYDGGDQEEAPRPRWLDRHHPEASSLSGEERRQLVRSLGERALAVGPPLPEGARYELDLGGPHDTAWLDAQTAQLSSQAPRTDGPPSPSTAPSAPREQDRPVGSQNQRPQTTPSADGEPSPSGTGPTGDPGRQSSSDRPETHRDSEDLPAPRQPRADDLSGPSTNSHRREWDNLLQAFQDWRTNWPKPRTPEEEARLRSDWRAKWSLPDTSGPDGNRPSQRDTDPLGDRTEQHAPSQTETHHTPADQPAPRPETGPAQEAQRSPVPAEVTPAPAGRPRDEATAQPPRPVPQQTSGAQPRPPSRAENDGGSHTPPQDRGDTPQQKEHPLPEQPSDPDSDLFAFFDQALNGPADNADGDSAQGTTRTSSGEEPADGPAPASDGDRVRETAGPRTAPEATESDPSRKQPEDEDGRTAKEEDTTGDGSEDTPDGNSRKKDDDENGTGGGEGSGGNRSGGSGGDGSSGGGGDRSGSGGGDRADDRDGSEGGGGGPAPEGDGGHSSAQPQSDSASQETQETRENQEEDNRPATEILGLENKPAGDPRFPSDLTDGRILGTIPDNRTGKDDSGRITTVDGKPLQEFQNDLLTMRVAEIKNIFKEKIPVRVDSRTFHRPDVNPPSDPDANPLTEVVLAKNDLGAVNGAVNAIVVDRVTGTVAEGLNGRARFSVIPADRLHPRLKERIDAMYSERGYPMYDPLTGEPMMVTDKNGRTIQRTSPYPHNDSPTRHAEIKAINTLLWERDDAQISDFQLDTWFTLKNDGSICPCCANCTRITRGARAPRSGKNSHPPGHPEWSRSHNDGFPDAQS